MSRKSEEDWQSDYQFTIDIFSMCEKYEDDQKQLERQISKLRNPVLFDSGLGISLPYRIISENKDYMDDHVMGMKNIGMFIFKNKIYKKWKSVQDYKDYLNILLTTIKCPSLINNKKTYKNDWVHNFNDIDDCINWYKKLKMNGILQLENIKTGEIEEVEYVWQKWYETNKQYLV